MFYNLNGFLMRLMHCCVSVILILVISASIPVAAADLTHIELTDEVMIQVTSRFGMNLGDDKYFSGAVYVKKRVQQNYEGCSYRQCHYGPMHDENGISTWFTLSDGWRQALKGGRYTVLNGPSKGCTGIIKEISKTQFKHKGKMKDFDYFLLDKKIEKSKGRIGIMIESYNFDEGQYRKLGTYDSAASSEIAIGDVPPGSFGSAALRLKGSQEGAFDMFRTHYPIHAATTGTWQVRFWSKAEGAGVTLNVGVDEDYCKRQNLSPEQKWQLHELSIAVDTTKMNQNKGLNFTITASGGDVLIDDVEIWLEGDTNPTAFRDDLVDTLKILKPGILRFLQMGGNTIDGTIMPPLRSRSFTSVMSSTTGAYAGSKRNRYGLHEMYELCELVVAEPWFCLPGTLNHDEMRSFVEYLSAPADVGYGKIRAELGHPEPWTDVFKNIHIEFGNEAWNNASSYKCGGFNGSDYWNDLIAAGKASPHYAKQILFHAAGQGANPSRNADIMADTPNADRFAIAPYLIQQLNQKDMAEFSDDHEFFRWAFGWALHRHQKGAMSSNFEEAQKAKVELSIYEINHHVTKGDASVEDRNRLTTSIGGALNVVNSMLLMLKEHQIRSQCFFTMAQHSYKANNIGRVRLWGSALTMLKGQQRYRPTFLALAAVNQILGGNLVKTIHSGANPGFDAEGTFSKKTGKETLKDLPCLWSYGFSDGSRRGMILVNLDTSQAHQISLKLPGVIKNGSAKKWLLSGDNISANNEFEFDQAQVQLIETTINGFASDHTISLPAHSLSVLSWELE